MRTRALFVLLMLSAMAMPLTARAETYFGFHVGVGNAPPPPRILIRQEPAMVPVPRSEVYVVRDYPYDLFHYGPYWYLSSNGYWYRARTYGGPFRVVDARSVPRPIYYVPATHWKSKQWVPVRARAAMKASTPKSYGKGHVKAQGKGHAKSDAKANGKSKGKGRS